MRLDQGNESWRPFFRLPRKGKGAIGGTRQNDSQREAIRPLPLEPASTPHDTPACSSVSSLCSACRVPISNLFARKEEARHEHHQPEREQAQPQQRDGAVLVYSTRPRPFFGTLPTPVFYCTSLACALPNLVSTVPRFLFPFSDRPPLLLDSVIRLPSTPT